MNGLLMKYFVLKPGGIDAYAKASRKAMLTYASYIEDENYQLATELEEWVKLEDKKCAEVKP